MVTGKKLCDNKRRVLSRDKEGMTKLGSTANKIWDWELTEFEDEATMGIYKKTLEKFPNQAE